MSTAFLAWRAPESHRWYTVGRLTAEAAAEGRAGIAHGGPYRFEYTGGAEDARRDAGFAPLASFPDFGTRYLSEGLFPFFANRLLPRSRPEYEDYVDWLSVAEGRDDPLALLARSGGRRATDAFELYPRPEPDGTGGVRLHFFAHGVRHFPPAAVERAERLQTGEPLSLMHDLQNRHDPRALVLRTAEAVPNDYFAIGFVPRYLAGDVHRLLTRTRDDALGSAEPPRVTVERVNPPPAPAGFRVLCRLTARWPEGYEPFADAAHRLLPAERTAEAPPRARPAAAVG